MITRQDIKHIHLEVSSDCNARCPQCPRNYCGYPHNFGYKVTNLTLNRIKELLPVEFVSQLEEILVNGNYGDFVMNPESIEIIAWFRKHNPNLIIKISTNGGARTTQFWQDLAKYNPEVLFCIDGLEDTHAIYRQNTIYETVIKNATAFINAGGNATWIMTEFDHNLHQIKEAEAISKKLGFYGFINRPSNRNTGPIYDKQGNKIFVMKEEKYYSPDKLDDEWLKNRRSKTIKTKLEPVPVTCEVLGWKSIYVSAEGTVDPCCYLGLEKPDYKFWGDIDELKESAELTTLDSGIEWYNKVISTFNTPNQLNGCTRSCGTNPRLKSAKEISQEK